MRRYAAQSSPRLRLRRSRIAGKSPSIATIVIVDSRSWFTGQGWSIAICRSAYSIPALKNVHCVLILGRIIAPLEPNPHGEAGGDEHGRQHHPLPPAETRLKPHRLLLRLGNWIVHNRSIFWLYIFGYKRHHSFGWLLVSNENSSKIIEREYAKFLAISYDQIPLLRIN